MLTKQCKVSNNSQQNNKVLSIRLVNLVTFVNLLEKCLGNSDVRRYKIVIHLDID